MAKKFERKPSKGRPPKKKAVVKKNMVAIKTKPDKKEAALLKRNKIAQINRDKASEVQEIGPLPQVKNPARKKACEKNALLYLKTYFPATFCLEWSEDQIKIVKTMQSSILKGGNFAFAMPRSSGKTSICKGMVLWAISYGHRKFVYLIGDGIEAAIENIEDIKHALETEMLIMEDFPEICYPIQQLQANVKRAIGQRIDGVRTRLEWGSRQIVFPCVKGSKCSGSIIRFAGILSRIRGASKRGATGEQMRPDLLVIDDPQSDSSAISESQVKKRMKVINSALSGLGGVGGKKMSILMPCTVICRDDLADKFLNKEANPLWHGIKTKMLYKWPTNLKSWEEYRSLYFQDHANNDDDLTLSTAFYIKKRKKLDAGAKIAWKDRYDEGEVSAIQHAMNLYFKDEEAFFSEYQNTPQTQDDTDEYRLKTEDIQLKGNGLKRYEVPNGTINIGMHIDVGDHKLHYTIVAYAEDFRCAVIDYGMYPKGQVSMKKKGADPEVGIIQGLNYLHETVVKKKYYGSGGEYTIGKCLIDAAYLPEASALFIEGKSGELYTQARGLSLTAKDIPIPDRKPKHNQELGFHWYRDRVRGKPRYYNDVNRWKTKAHRKLSLSIGDRGNCSLFGSTPRVHYDWAYSVARTEKRSESFGRNGQMMEVWEEIPGRPNHYFDTFVGALIACSILGARDISDRTYEKKKEEYASFSEMQKKAKQRQGRM